MSLILGTIYRFINEKSNTAADLDVKTVDGKETKSIVGYTSKTSANQKWILESVGEGNSNLYHIQTCRGEGGDYLSIVGEVKAGASLTCSSTPQKWLIVKDSVNKSVFKVFHPTRDLCLEVEKGSNQDNTKIILSIANTERRQSWNFTVFEPLANLDSIYKIKNKSSGTFGTLSPDPKDSTKNVFVGSKSNSNDDQKWKILSAGLDLYYIKNIKGDYLSIVDGKHESDTPVVGASSPQAWRIIRNPKHRTALRIYHPTLDRCMDLNDGLSEDKTTIQLIEGKPKNNTDNIQNWELVDV